MSITHSSLFAAGFRPFFLLSGLYAGVILPVWLLLYMGVMPQFGLPPLLWHGHEMIFGFLLTAGCFGLMILGMMSRVSLGHTGRELRVSGWIIAAYIMVAAGTLLRLLSSLLERAQIPLLHSGGSL